MRHSTGERRYYFGVGLRPMQHQRAPRRQSARTSDALAYSRPRKFVAPGILCSALAAPTNAKVSTDTIV
jgi:hypothetical protein